MSAQELVPDARRMRCQFSLRMLLLSITCCATAIGGTLQVLGTPRPGRMFQPTYESTKVLNVSLPGSDEPMAFLGSHLTLTGNDAARLVQSREFLEDAAERRPELAEECRKDGATDVATWLREQLQTSAS